MKRLLACIMASLLFLLIYWGNPSPAVAQTKTIADSVSDFSGSQGEKNWYYGYYSGSLTSADFKKMQEFDGQTWWVKQGSYSTRLSADKVHPNSRKKEQWAVRRWVSPVAGNLKISGHLAKIDPRGDAPRDGVTGSIIVDGKTIWSEHIAANDTTGIDYNVSAEGVKVGSTVDFAIAPGVNAFNDKSTFTAQISYTPENLNFGNVVKSAPSEEIVTVNIDATKNYSKSKAAVVTLPAGEYRVHVIGKAEGGLFDAGSVTSSTKGCRADGTKCKLGWEHDYRIRPGNKYIKVEGTGKYATAYLALSNAPVDASFILGSESEVKFYIYNPSSPRNNRGGVSLKVESIN